MPWEYIRRQLARDWYVSPKEFDRIILDDPEELRIELAIRRAEVQAEKKKKR